MGWFGDTGQRLIKTLEGEGELVVFHAHEVEDRSLQVLGGSGVFNRLIADGVGGTVGLAAFDYGTHHLTPP